MDMPSRSRFLIEAGAFSGATPALGFWPAGGMSGGQSPSGDTRSGAYSGIGSLSNDDIRTAIGLGDELASIVDKFGQLRSRKAELRLEIGDPPRPASDFKSSQSLAAGMPRLDDIYRTSLINLLLLRTKYAGAGPLGQDIYALKPGATRYDNYWVRDGAYMAVALDLVGLHEEAERSLRIFWQTDLDKFLAPWGQRADGCWQAPMMQWDGQGQALWALVHHFELVRNKKWLREVYPAIRTGALWIKSVTAQTRILNENAERPIYYGLLPVGEGETIAFGYNYYHDFWAVLGLRMAIAAAQALQERDDLDWMRRTCREFSENLLASLKLAYQRTGNNQFIPATPYDTNAPIWGSIPALYRVCPIFHLINADCSSRPCERLA